MGADPRSLTVDQRGTTFKDCIPTKLYNEVAYINDKTRDDKVLRQKIDSELEKLFQGATRGGDPETGYTPTSPRQNAPVLHQARRSGPLHQAWQPRPGR